jgi:putative endonuclease
VYVEACTDRSGALRRERAIKRLAKPAKERLVAGAIIQQGDSETFA